MKKKYWYAVDEDGTGKIFANKPSRYSGIWAGGNMIGSVYDELKSQYPAITWEEEPVKIEIDVKVINS